MEGESDDPEGSQSFDQHSANCELYGVMGHCGRNSILFLISEVYNFLSTIFDSLLLTLLLSSTLKMIFSNFLPVYIFSLSDASIPIRFYFFLDRRVFEYIAY